MASDPRGHLDLLLLSVVSAGPAHGYAIIETLREHSEGAFDLKEGSVYPALHRLEAAGLLASRWAPHAGRRRRVYRLTRRGRGALAEERREWAGLVRAVDLVVAGAS